MKTKILLLLLVVMLALTTTVAYAAKVPCKSYYTVYATDTLRRVSLRTGVSPYDIMRANKNIMQKPNYSIFPGKLCIPVPETSKTFPAWVLDQPAASVYARPVGKQLVITAYNFPLNSNWAVKVDGKKIGKIKILKKALFSKSFKLPPNAKSVCFKNQMTDFQYCAKVIR